MVLYNTLEKLTKELAESKSHHSTTSYSFIGVDVTIPPDGSTAWCFHGRDARKGDESSLNGGPRG